MAGQFSPTSRPPRPGAYFDFNAVTPQPVFVNTLGRVAVPITHSWGPANQVVECFEFSDFLKFFGDGGSSLPTPVYTAGYKAVRQAFQGEGLPGRGGAGEVLVYRMVGSGGAASTITLQNTSAAPAITLTAVYKGTFGNNVAVAVVTDARNPTTQLDLQVYVQGVLVETFVFNKTDITGLAAKLSDPNFGSKWVVPSSVTTGVALATVVTPAALTAGNDGATLSGTDISNMLAVYGNARFGVFAMQDIAATSGWDDTLGSAALASLLSWQAYQNASGKRFMTVIGGDANDTATSAQGRSQLANDPNVINVGDAVVSDAVFGTLTTSQLAPRLAGVIAGRTEKQGLSFARLAGVTLTSGPTDSDLVASLTQGWMTLSRDSNANAPVRFEKGLTTYAAPDTSRPLWAFSKPKFVLTMQSLENELTEWAESNVVGQMPVDDGTVQFVIGHMQTVLKQRERDRIIQSGWSVVRDPNIPTSPQDEFIALRYGLTFDRDVEQVLNTVVVS